MRKPSCDGGDGCADKPQGLGDAVVGRALQKAVADVDFACGQCGIHGKQKLPVQISIGKGRAIVVGIRSRNQVKTPKSVYFFEISALCASSNSAFISVEQLVLIG